tara:strand:- start:250 stop:525 length:276 start_codon:yes stop_codon:yes gene_type:complete
VRREMSSAEITPSAREVYEWVKSKVEDRSHSCDAVWQLLVALDAVSQGVVGGYMDLDGVAMVRAFLDNPMVIKEVSYDVYHGNMATNRTQG